jgi:predicted class III extradiol MEMO1 family dioxygenase
MNIVITQAALLLAPPILALLVFTPFKHAGLGDQPKIRQAAVAGSFYPDDPKVLSAMIDDMLAKVSSPPVSEPILAVVAPHAGYQFSGPVAAYTYAALKGHKFTRVVVIAPSHYEAFD